jgi:hypothetical protein
VTSSKIPSRIIQTGRTPLAQLPLASRAASIGARALHPDYEYCYFDDAAIADFVTREFPEHQRVFSRFQFPIQRVDFFRYLVIYRLGGFYLDLDVFLAKRLDPLRVHRCVFPFEELTISQHLRRRHGVDWEIGNYAFGAEPQHPFMLAVINNCVRCAEEPARAQELYRNIPAPFRGQFIVTNTTGPGLVTRTLAEQPPLRSAVTILFPADVCEPTTWHRFGDYGVHLMTASWRTSDGRIRKRLTRAWETRTRKRFLRESQSLGPRREGEWSIALPE